MTENIFLFFRCEEFSNCALCKIHNNGEYNQNQCENLCNYSVIRVDRLSKEDPTKKQCRVPDNGTCIVLFEYFYQNNDVVIRVLREKFCPKPVNVIGKDI